MKYTLLIIAILSSAMLHAGNGIKSQNSNNKLSNAAVIFSEDFSNGIPINWVLTDNASSGDFWVHTTTGPAFAQIDPDMALSPNGTTAANGYIMFDSDGIGQDSMAEDSEIRTVAINCSSNSIVLLSFNEFFLQFNNSTATVDVSNDGTTWTNFYHAETGLSIDEGTPNPNQVNLDISSVAANQATVYIRFRYTGDYDYFWLVDDVMLREPAAIDGSVISILTPNSSCTIPGTADVNIRLTNRGFNAISNFQVGYSLNNGTVVSETFTGTLNSGDTADFQFSTQVSLPSNGNYELKAFTELTGDGNLLDDTTLTMITIGPADLTSPYVMGFEPGEDVSLWSDEDTDADGVRWEIVSGYPRTGMNAARIPFSLSLSQSPDNYLFTGCLDLTAGDYTLEYWYKTFDVFLQGYSLESYIGTDANSTSMTQMIAMDPMPLDTSYQQSVTTFNVAADGIYYIGFRAHGQSIQSSMFLDDINLTRITSLSENKGTTINLYPNPADRFITVEGIKSSNAILTVTDIRGSVLITETVAGNSFELDTRMLENGVYILQLNDGGVNRTGKFIISR